MKKIVRFAFVSCCIVLIALFIISCSSAYVSPYTFSYMPLFALCFPYFFIALLIFAIICFFINRKWALLMLLCLLAGIPNLSKTAAFNVPAAFNNQKKDSALRILTWNVQSFVSLQYKSTTWLKMLDVIAEKNPDIICMQEFKNVEGGRKISILDKLDSMGYKHFVFSEDDIHKKNTGAIVTYGCAIFSKLSLTDSGRTNIIMQPEKESLAYIDVKFNNKPLRIFTAHLQSFELYNDTNNTQQDVYQITYQRKRFIQYKLRDVEKFHANEVATIRDAFSKTSIPYIYCGDMNTVPTSYTYNKLKGNLQDAFLAKGSGIGQTFYKILPTLRIDYIFADEKFKINQCAVIEKKLSDHYPVVTDIQWK